MQFLPETIVSEFVRHKLILAKHFYPQFLIAFQLIHSHYYRYSFYFYVKLPHQN